MRTTPLSTFLSSVAERGFSILGLSRTSRANPQADDLIELCRMLLSARGEASGIALSMEILHLYGLLDDDARTELFRELRAEFSASHQSAKKAAATYLSDPTNENLTALADSTRSDCMELIMRLNQAPDATRRLVGMRADLLERLDGNPELNSLDREFVSHFTSWFNRGFLELRNIDWNTPASILDKIIRYEAVHGMGGWNDLRDRIDPKDRMIYGFFHPRLGDEPLIFVEVALMDQMPKTIASVLGRHDPPEDSEPKTAVFYSISNCQAGLRGIPLGSFLIKQVVEDLRIRFPGLKDFVTLSPIPSLVRSLADDQFNVHQFKHPEAVLGAIAAAESGLLEDALQSREAENDLLAAAQWFLLYGKKADGRPIDPVARFHLGNGARLERVNWRADLSERGMKDSLGMMANYRYQLDEIEHNHEQFANDGTIAAASGVVRAARIYDSEARRSKPGPDPRANDADAVEAREHRLERT